MTADVRGRANQPRRPQEHSADGCSRGWGQLYPVTTSIGVAIWGGARLEACLWYQIDVLVGDNMAWLIIDDTALPMKDKASAGVPPQDATVLDKNANGHALVSI